MVFDRISYGKPRIGSNRKEHIRNKENHPTCVETKDCPRSTNEERHIGGTASNHGLHTVTLKRWIEELVTGTDKSYTSIKADKQAAQAKIEQEKQIDNHYA